MWTNGATTAVFAHKSTAEKIKIIVPRGEINLDQIERVGVKQNVKFLVTIIGRRGENIQIDKQSVGKKGESK